MILRLCPAGALDPCARDLDFFATPRRSIEAGFWLRFSIIKAASAIDCGNRSTKFNHELARRIGSRTRIEASKFRPNLAPHMGARMGQTDIWPRKPQKASRMGGWIRLQENCHALSGRRWRRRTYVRADRRSAQKRRADGVVGHSAGRDLPDGAPPERQGDHQADA